MSGGQTNPGAGISQTKAGGAALFVSELVEEANEMTLLDHFEKRGFGISNVQIYRNSYSNQPLGTGKIVFFSSEEATKALETMNYTEILGRKCRLMWFRKGEVANNLRGNIFIKNLDTSLTSKDLYEKFSKYGPIFSASVKTDAHGLSKGYGYVQFEKEESAQEAINELNGKDWGDKQLIVTRFVRRVEREPATYNNLYVKCFPKNYGSKELEELFTPYGNIGSAVVIKESDDSSENKGFGFVCFNDWESAKKAEEEMNGKEVDGQKLFVTKALNKSERKQQLRSERLTRYRDCNVYLKYLPLNVTDQMLAEAFSDIGTVVSCRVMTERKEDPATKQVKIVSKGFGFLCFATPEEAQKAIQEIKSKQYFGQHIYANIAMSKEERMRKYRDFMPPYFMFPYWARPYPRPMRGPRPFKLDSYGMPPMGPFQRPSSMQKRRPMPSGDKGPMGGRGKPNKPMMPRMMPRPEMMGPMSMPMMGPMMPNMGMGMDGMPNMEMMRMMQMQTPMGGQIPPMSMGMGMPPNMPAAYGMPQNGQEEQAEEISPTEDLQALGERLYPLIEKKDPTNAAKITGMLLEMERDAIVNIIKDENALNRMIDEAHNVLANAGTEQRRG